MILILAVKRRKNLLEETELSRRTDEPDAVLNKEEYDNNVFWRERTSSWSFDHMIRQYGSDVPTVSMARTAWG